MSDASALREALSRATIHVGLTKCASSTLQAVAQATLGVELIGDGPIDPLLDLAMRSALRPTVESFNFTLPDPPPAATQRFLISDARLVDWRTQRTLPLTGEQLAAYQEQCALLLRQLCPEGRVVVIARRPDRWLVSRYKQDTLMFNPDPLPRYCRKQAGYLRQAYGLDAIHRLYVGLFGAERVMVLPMERLQADPDDYYGRLNAFTGLGLDPAAVADGHRNASMDDAVIEQVRRFHATADAMARRGGGTDRQHWAVKRTMYGLINQTLVDQPRMQRAAKRLVPESQSRMKPPEDFLAELRDLCREIVRLPGFDGFREAYQTAGA